MSYTRYLDLMKALGREAMSEAGWSHINHASQQSVIENLEESLRKVLANRRQTRKEKDEPKTAVEIVW